MINSVNFFAYTMHLTGLDVFSPTTCAPELTADISQFRVFDNWRFFGSRQEIHSL